MEHCSKENTRFETSCEHVLTQCPLCLTNDTFCIDHGCVECQLKAKDANVSMLMMPDDERLMMLEIVALEAAYKEERPKVKKAKKWQQQDIEDVILNGSRATYTQSQRNCFIRPRTR